MDKIEAVAEAWASIDGELDDFRRERELKDPISALMNDPTFTGRYIGYVEDASELIRRVEARGFTVVPSAKPQGE